MAGIKRLLILPKVKIHNANALSSPFTIGFPAMTAWLGAMHALQRKIVSKGFDDLNIKSVGVISHDFNLQTYKGVGDYVSSIVGTGNPLDKSGNRSAFIEEPRCHLTVTIVAEYVGVDIEDNDKFIAAMTRELNATMKVAGGDIIGFKPPTVMKFSSKGDRDLPKLKRQLMPGYALVERRELLEEAMKQGQDPMDAILDYVAVHHHSEQDENGVVEWQSQRKEKGWIVPIATGFHGISDLGNAKNQRDPEVPHRFAESIVTLGEFKMPHRIHAIEDILWEYSFDENNLLYLCQQVTTKKIDTTINDLM
jgi:CRISPR-associated protein Csy2